MFRPVLSRSSLRAFSTSNAAANVAKMTLVGRIGSELEPLTSKAGKPYLKYSLAVRTGKDQTSWFNVSALDPRTIEFMTQYVEKGSLVYVEADASMNQYEVEGQNRTSLNLVQQTISPLIWPKRTTEGEGHTEGN